ncbi:CopD family protein [Methylophilus sp. 5]|uniref:CopD family protein n=1 Tax=Methylophilus sp. 5 TaxID=1112274 RepID=UPI00048BE037|nr:CopD family protein [Methylophilus sp. 5]
MLWVKAFHLIFVTSWFAGLFYLPRIYVNLAMEQDPQAQARLLLMAHKLYRFMQPLMLLALAFGIWLWLGYGFKGGWLHAKLTLVALLIGYQHACGSLLKKFSAQQNRRSHVWFRWFNEVPVLILFAIVILVVTKPF